MIPPKRHERGGEMQTQAGQITELLAIWREGDRAALDRLLPLIHTELHRLARRHLAHERKNHSMQPSSLVQEAFLRLLPGVNAGWRDRAHFFAAASQVMRHVLVDYARERRRVKRGGAVVHIPVDAAVVLSPEQVEQIVAVDVALQRLAKADERKSKVLNTPRSCHRATRKWGSERNSLPKRAFPRRRFRRRVSYESPNAFRRNVANAICFPFGDHTGA